MASRPDVRVRRVYDEPAGDDGTRVLVDRIWPRGLTRAEADLAEWCKHVARRPSYASGTATTRRSSRSSSAAIEPSSGT